jgi:hypothetical protein
MKLFEIAEQRESKISELKFLDLLKHSARNSHALAKRTPIFKLIRSSSDFLLLNPTIGSKRPKFYIESLIAELPSWSRYPNRARSIVAYTSREVAEASGEGSMYVIIPLDGVRITVTSDTALTRSFKKAAIALQLPKVDNEGIAVWFESLYKVANAVGLDVEYKDPQNYKDIKNMLSALEPISIKQVAVAKELPDAGIDVQRFIKFAQRRGNAMMYLNELFDPDDNGYELMTPDSTQLPIGREVWVGGKAIAIKRDKYQELYDRGAIK